MNINTTAVIAAVVFLAFLLRETVVYLIADSKADKYVREIYNSPLKDRYELLLQTSNKLATKAKDSKFDALVFTCFIKKSNKL